MCLTSTLFVIGFVSLFILLLNRNSFAQMCLHQTCDVKTMCYIVFISHSLDWRYIKTALQEYVINNHKTDICNPETDTIYADKHFNECITKRFGFLKEPLFYSTSFLYVKDDDKRDRLEKYYIRQFKPELNP